MLRTTTFSNELFDKLLVGRGGYTLNRKCAYFIAMVMVLVIFMVHPAIARRISFQPRLEMGVMQYKFESEAFSRTILPGYNKTFSAFKYEDIMSFVSAGMTFFLDRLFFDISGQYAFDGNDSGTMTRSSFTVDSYDADNNFFPSSYVAYSPQYEVKFDRTDYAVSLGYALTNTFSLFGGYKMAETQFTEKYDGPYSVRSYDANNSTDDIYYTGGRWWGNETFKFEYSGPFIGFIQGWDFTESRYLKGVLTTNVAFAFLEGKMKSGGGGTFGSITRINDQQIPEHLWDNPDTNLGSLNDTKGDALGLKVSLSWRGSTPFTGLSYLIGASGYRYEFDANKNLAYMSETAINFKVGLSYVF